MESKVFTADYLIPEYYAKSHNTYLFLYTGTYVVSHEFAYVKTMQLVKLKTRILTRLAVPWPFFNGKTSHPRLLLQQRFVPY